MRKNLLVTSPIIGEPNLTRLTKNARVFASWKMEDNEIQEILPDIDALLVLSWPSFLDGHALTRMERLRFVQSILVGVNHVPFIDLGSDVAVASNAGAYSLEVGEHAWALILAAAKKIVAHDVRIKEGARTLSEFDEDAPRIMVLDGKTLGIVGYGGIGRSAARYAQTFGMKVLPFGRGSKGNKSGKLLSGKAGFEHLLRKSDVVLLSIPLSNSTLRLIGERELSIMKENSILVNIARGDLVDQKSLYSHLKKHPKFTYATDAWWLRDRRESLVTEYPFDTLGNFIGTPHTSGPTSVYAGLPATLATDNVLRYLKGRTPRNLVNRAEYLEMKL